jgi:L-alanine-DL-glutamate epimerase-like enolase superfamily enzyme
LAAAVDTPVCTGEDIYLKEDFVRLFERRAIAVAHPDLASSGGILETKKIGDLAQEHGIAMALHMAMSPIAALASVHCAAATENFMVLENHSVDQLQQWSGLVQGLPVPLIENGYIKVPEGPGLGFSGLNEDVLKQFVDGDIPGIFESTEAWDNERAHDRLWS